MCIVCILSERAYLNKLIIIYVQDKGKDEAYGTGDRLLKDRKKTVATRFDVPELVKLSSRIFNLYST